MDNLRTPGGMLDQFGLGVQLINSMFVFIHGLAEITNKKNTIKPLKDVVEIMRNEMKTWKERVSL